MKKQGNIYMYTEITYVCEYCKKFKDTIKDEVAQSLYSHNSLQKLSCRELIEKIEFDDNVTKKYDEYTFQEQNGSTILSLRMASNRPHI